MPGMVMLVEVLHSGEEGRGGAWRRTRTGGRWCSLARGQVGGAAEWNEGEIEDVEGRREEARVGQNHVKADAAMVDRGELRRDGAILESK